MALALLCGVLIRRVLPAMIAFIVRRGMRVPVPDLAAPVAVRHRDGSQAGQLEHIRWLASQHHHLHRADLAPDPQRAAGQRPAGGEQPECLDRAASLHILGRLPAAQPPDLARAGPQRHPHHGRRLRRARLGVVAPHPPSRLSRSRGRCMSSSHVPFLGPKDASAIDLAGRDHRVPGVGCAVTTCEQALSRPAARAHTGDMGRIIGTILGAILAIWLVFMAAGGIFATLKTFLIIGLIAMAIFIVVWLVAGRPRRG